MHRFKLNVGACQAYVSFNGYFALHTKALYKRRYLQVHAAVSAFGNGVKGMTNRHGISLFILRSTSILTRFSSCDIKPGFCCTCVHVLLRFSPRHHVRRKIFRSELGRRPG